MNFRYANRKYDKGITKKDTVTVECMGQIKTLKLFTMFSNVNLVTVDMGKPEFTPAKVPVLASDAMNIPLTVSGETYFGNCVSVGNPHCVIFCDKPDELNLKSIGPLMENHPLFPERVNTEFVRVIDKTTIKMRVFECGNGETGACGTGACAAAAIAVKKGYCSYGQPITVKAADGDLTVVYTDEKIELTGDTKLIFESTFSC